MLFLKALLYAILGIAGFCGVTYLLFSLGKLGMYLFGPGFVPVVLVLFIIFCVTMAIYETMKAERKRHSTK